MVFFKVDTYNISTTINDLFKFEGRQVDGKKPIGDI